MRPNWRSPLQSPLNERVEMTTILLCPSLSRMDRTESPTLAKAPESFEAAQAELDELVRAMETGQMPLDGLLSAYKRGAQLLEFCRSRLDAVEEQVKVLEEGQLKPWTRP
jgi:exodeoxyribonuclease VII small subunit